MRKYLYDHGHEKRSTNKSEFTQDRKKIKPWNLIRYQVIIYDNMCLQGC